jgi:hypothetical protein
VAIAILPFSAIGKTSFIVPQTYDKVWKGSLLSRVATIKLSHNRSANLPGLMVRSLKWYPSRSRGTSS